MRRLWVVIVLIAQASFGHSHDGESLSGMRLAQGHWVEVCDGARGSRLKVF
jgi:hypothetical protein